MSKYPDEIDLDIMINFLSQPWPWYVAGPLIALTMTLLLFFGERFGVSSNFRTMCTLSGAGRVAEFFRFDWKAQRWNLVFILGALIGGFISANYLSDGSTMLLSEKTVSALSEMGFTSIGDQLVPMELFGMERLGEPMGLALLLIGGALVGFGARYAGGCTSGHAISGLSELQWPSLIAVIGFFIGGLIMTHLIIPQLF